MKDLSKLSDTEKSVILARREYMRQWRKNNPQKQKEYEERFFAKQLQKQQQAT